jgi:hypothetical protein
MIQRLTAVVLLLLFATVLLFAAAQETPNWKRYLSSDYGLEMSYPENWTFIGDQNNDDRPTPAGQHPAHAGDTRGLFSLEMEGPTQSQDGGGPFDDGVIVGVGITGTSGIIEDWNMKPNGQWYLRQSAPSDWVKHQTLLGPGDGLKTVAVDANGFTGSIQIVCVGSHPCNTFEEEGAAYRMLPSGRVVFVTWYREAGDAGGNDFSYEKYFLPMLSTFKLLK